MNTLHPLPYGVCDLTQQIVTDPGPPIRVQCYVAGCDMMLRPASRGFRGDLCPIHRIHCHLSGNNVTYTYQNPEHNLIASPRLFTSKVRRNPHKYESHRFGYCNSEDATTWCVFRSLQEAKALHLIAQYITGEKITSEPQLFLWGLSSSGDRFEPWSLLNEARQQFEVNKLPVARPYTEPDASLWIPGRFLCLIEAKLGSTNPFVVKQQPRKTPQSLTMDELVHLYWDPSLKILDIEKVRAAEMTYPQLHRNLVFAEYLARADGPYTKAYMVNLVRAGYEVESGNQFRQLLHPQYADRFVRLSWESIYVLSGLHFRELSRLQEYMVNKAIGGTGGFAPAFQIEIG